MRILQWAFPHTPPLGGREVFIERLSRSLVDAHHEVIVLADAESTNGLIHVENLLTGNVPIHRFNLSVFGDSRTTGKQPGLRAEIKRIIDDFNPDVIHFHNFFSKSSVFLNAYLRSSKRKIPTVFTIHDVETLSKIPDSLGGEIVGRMTDAIVCPSQYIYRRLVAQKGLSDRKVVVIENGVPKKVVQDELVVVVNSDAVQVLAAANFEMHKGLLVLLTAWGRIANNFPHSRLIIAGSGKEKEFLQGFATKLGVGKSVSFPGWLSDENLTKEFERDTIVVVPSLIPEAFGLIAAEAQMAGLPVVASNVGGLSEIVLDKTTGYLVPPGNSSALSDALTNLLENPKLRRDLGEAGRLRAENLFTMARCTDKYVDLYQSLREETN